MEIVAVFCVCVCAAVGVSTLWLNLFFQTPSHLHYQSEGEETSAVCYYACRKGFEGQAESRFSVFSKTLSNRKLLNRKSEGSRRAPVCLLGGQEIKDPAGNKRLQLLKQRLDGAK